MQDLGIQSQPLDQQDMTDGKAAQSQGMPQAVPSAVTASQATEHPAVQTDYITELERLADLRDQGIITAEEFEAKKRQLLGL